MRSVATSHVTRKSLKEKILAKFAIVLLDDCIAFARELFKFLSIQNLYRSTCIRDYILPLQNTGCHGDGGSICTEHDISCRCWKRLKGSSYLSNRRPPP